MRDLSIEGKITIFKLAISKIVPLGLITNVPVFIIKQLNKIKKKKLFSKKKKQQKYTTLIYEILTS